MVPSFKDHNVRTCTVHTMKQNLSDFRSTPPRRQAQVEAAKLDENLATSYARVSQSRDILESRLTSLKRPTGDCGVPSFSGCWDGAIRSQGCPYTLLMGELWSHQEWSNRKVVLGPWDQLGAEAIGLNLRACPEKHVRAPRRLCPISDGWI